MLVGLIGLGRIGMLFTEVLLKEFPEIQILVYSPRLQKRFKNLTNNPRVIFTPDLKEFFQNETVAGYIIAAPSDTHFDYVVKIAKKKKPIFCEKPLDLSLSRIKKIKELTEKNGILLTVGFNRRFDPEIMELKKEIQSGTIGIPHIIRITSRDPAPPSLEFLKSSGGLFLDMIIHDFDMSRFLLEDEPVSIYAEADVLIDPKIGQLGDFDTAVSTLKFKKGTIVVIDDSRKAVYGYDQRIEVFGSKGMISNKNQRDHSLVKYLRSGSHMIPYKNFFMERYHQSYVNEIKEFINICRGERGNIVTIDDAYQATKIAHAAIKSAKGKKRITVL